MVMALSIVGIGRLVFRRIGKLLILRLTPRGRLDETAAARKPVLRWRPAAETKEAAE